ncbi:mitochondrial 18 KDa protein-domain-containing protein [Rhodotorula diobovata]|uniref:Mitochondrial fission process protein 1 n=1 Tax=Rhodotorula diobovata TaxID=5288 RepID=A0A5C5FZ04_9BASI|nr:mitochondrial 18 KDa protein-domain-containing protein [Rhodotorula diobovata]
MDKARELEASFEKSLEATEQQVIQGQIDSTDTNARYLGYLARLRPVLITSSRYLAYSSDVGESFRPVVAPKIVTAAYGVSWAYVTGDCGYEAYKAWMRAKETAPDAVGSVVGLTFAKRAVFQATASMLLPSLTIHSIVKYSAMALKKWGVQNVRVRQWLPSALGLGFIPFLPALFDEPVEGYVDTTFDRLERKLFPDEASPVRRTLDAGKHHTQVLHERADKEKEE